ncbi:MAG: hypothetical protein KDC69_10025 [Flavobacteriaceae bacterium]|nr:hypothetical protein [Flavobacteriaceae bacterium]
MNEREDKDNDIFLRNTLRNIPLNTPSDDFTDRVMDRIYAEQANKMIRYSPLISLKGWLAIAGMNLLMVTYLIRADKNESPAWPYLNAFFDKIKDLKVLHFSFDYPETLKYGFIFLAVMLLFQVSFLKKHFDKHLNS